MLLTDGSRLVGTSRFIRQRFRRSGLAFQNGVDSASRWTQSWSPPAAIGHAFGSQTDKKKKTFFLVFFLSSAEKQKLAIIFGKSHLCQFAYSPDSLRSGCAPVYVNRMHSRPPPWDRGPCITGSGPSNLQRCDYLMGGFEYLTVPLASFWFFLLGHKKNMVKDAYYTRYSRGTWSECSSKSAALYGSFQLAECSSPLPRATELRWVAFVRHVRTGQWLSQGHASPWNRPPTSEWLPNSTGSDDRTVK